MGKIKFFPGKIRLASFHVKHNTKDLIVFDIDCNSKYYETSVYETDDHFGIQLIATKVTLRTSNRKGTTKIEITKPLGKWRDDWSISVEPFCRYSFKVFLVRDKKSLSHHNLQNSRPEEITF